MFEELLAGAVRDLIEYRRSLPPSMAEEAIREAVAGRAREMGLTVHALVPEKYREEACSATVRDLAHQAIDSLLSGRDSMTVGGLLEGVNRVVPWTESLVDFVESCAESEKVPPLENAFAEGGAKTFVPRLGNVGIPVVIAWTTPMSNVGEVIRQMKDEHLRQFGRLFRMGPEARREAAGYFRMMVEGKSNREIADIALKREGFDLRAVDEDEYRRELRRRTDKVRQFRKRFVQ